ncbi:hypothetical protein AO373_1628 [Moraxella catarrhalis]|nr:hypothetical protein AO380_1687 [Moraxella catarrhalis]OAV17818.1 hypothetical protein AO373_1628 [Moraxella catarrhalis]OAV30496.1 hypothetical protein AO367_1090 [Moraxella catarrhalis]
MQVFFNIDYQICLTFLLSSYKLWSWFLIQRWFDAIGLS